MTYCLPRVEGFVESSYVEGIKLLIMDIFDANRLMEVAQSLCNTTVH